MMTIKVSIEELLKALDYAKKNGDPQAVSLGLDHRNNIRLEYYTDSHGQIIITIFSEEAQKFPEVTRTERL